MTEQKVKDEVYLLLKGEKFTGEFAGVQYRIFLRWSEDWSAHIDLRDMQVIDDNPWLEVILREMNMSTLCDLLYSAFKLTPEYQAFQDRIDKIRNLCMDNPKVDEWVESSMRKFEAGWGL